MKKLLLLLFIPIVCFGQEDIERYKVYETTNIYTSLLLDSATGKIWQLQIGVGDTDRLRTVLSEREYAETIETITEDWNQSMEEWEEEYNSKPDSIVSVEDKAYWKPSSLEKILEYRTVAKNGRFKLYPTGNMYNFIMVDVINGKTYQVQWSTKKDSRLVFRIW
jgi:hypothetical protein